MSDLQAETSPPEQPAFEDSGDTHKADFWTVATTFAIAFYIGWKLLDALESELVKAYVLRFFVHLCARWARSIGEASLQLEQLYYDTVRSLPYG
jgi:hypothetical protein